MKTIRGRLVSKLFSKRPRINKKNKGGILMPKRLLRKKTTGLINAKKTKGEERLYFAQLVISKIIDKHPLCNQTFLTALITNIFSTVRSTDDIRPISRSVLAYLCSLSTESLSTILLHAAQLGWPAILCENIKTGDYTGQTQLERKKNLDKETDKLYVCKKMMTGGQVCPHCKESAVFSAPSSGNRSATKTTTFDYVCNSCSRRVCL